MARVPALVVVVLLVVSCSTDRRLDTRGSAPSGPGLHRLEDFPLDHRSDVAFVWTGDRLFVWGGISVDDPSTGRRSLGDGAVLTPGGVWTKLPATPFPHGLYGSLGAWDGTEVVVIGSECDETIPPDTTGEPPRCTSPAAVAWNPRTDTWRRLPAPPIPATPETGGKVLRTRGVALGGEGTALFVDQASGTALQWDRGSGRWTTAPGPTGEYVVACADPTRPWIVTTGGTYGSPSSGRRIWTIRAEPNGTPAWSEMPPPHDTVGASSCGAGRVVGNAGFELMLVDVATGASTPLRTAPTATAPDRSPVSSATLVGWWLFESTNYPGPPLSTTTSLPLEQANPGPATTLAPSVPPTATEPTASELTPSWTVRIVPDGAPLRFDGDEFNLLVWAGTTVATDDGVISCDLRTERRCSMWVAPPEARPSR